MEQTPTRFEALEHAIRVVGSQEKFAGLCGVSQPAVWKWLKVSKQLPAESVLTVEEATKVSRHYLRPDIYPYRDASKLPPLPALPTAPRRRRRAANDDIMVARA